MEANVSEERMYEIVKRAIEEVMDKKLLEIRLSLIPEVDENEMRALEKEIGKPEDYKKDDYVKVDLRNVDL